MRYKLYILFSYYLRRVLSLPFYSIGTLFAGYFLTLGIHNVFLGDSPQSFFSSLFLFATIAIFLYACAWFFIPSRSFPFLGNLKRLHARFERKIERLNEEAQEAKDELEAILGTSDRPRNLERSLEMEKFRLEVSSLESEIENLEETLREGGIA